MPGAGQTWDDWASTFDEEADHGLRDPAVRQAWASLLLPLLPTAPANVADLGCGTGSLSVLVGEAGYQVHGLDGSPRMLDVARHKASAAGVSVSFVLGDAADPPFAPGSFDVVLARHVLWALPMPDAVIAGWVRLLKTGGRLVLVEGRWSTGSGIVADECRALVLRHRQDATLQRLDDPALWGKTIVDDRYLILSRE